MNEHRRYRLICLLLLLAVSSCTVVRKYRPNVPFVYENKINLNGRYDASVKTNLLDGLNNQIEDSVKPRIKDIMFVRHVINSPSAFDSNDVFQSRDNMQFLLKNNGYFRGMVDPSWKMDTLQQGQVRVTVTYDVTPGKVFRIDSIAYQFYDSNLQKLADSSRRNTFLKKGEPYSNDLVNKERDRLTSIFRENGYFKITQEEVIGQLDTVFAELISADLDVFQQLELLAKAQEKIEKPTINVTMLQLKNKDTTRLQQYHIGRVAVIPDEPLNLTAGSYKYTRRDYDSLTILDYNNTFDHKFIRDRIFLKSGELFRQENLNRTLTNFNRIEAWQTTSVQSRTNDSASTVDFLFRLIPSKRQQFTADIEATSILNMAQNVLLIGGNKGLAVNFSLKNRNIGKRAIELNNTLRAGIEFNNFSRILSSEFSLTNRLIFPWLIQPFKRIELDRVFSPKTFLSLDIYFINRFSYYKLNNFNTFFGYEWSNRRNTTWQVRIPNIEYTRLYGIDTNFIKLIRDFPLLAYSYNNGLIIGINGSYTRRFPMRNPRHVGLLRLFAEESGTLTGLAVYNLTNQGEAFGRLYRYLKMDIDYRHYINHKKSSWAFRGFFGYGYGLGTEATGKVAVNLPFFKQYFAGGPNSMRGWQLRKLGIGANRYYDTVLAGQFNDRYADIKMELNGEYRFDLFPIYSFWVRGALFVDVGNIWNRTTSGGVLPYADLSLSNFYRSLAVAGGGGIRLDFSFFLLRFDLGYKLKDPLYSVGPGAKPGGWFVPISLRDPTFHFAIGYPF